MISFMRSIYTYVPETNYVPREYSVAAVLLFLFILLISLVSVLNLLYFYISTFRSMCAVPNMAVFCSSLTSCFPGIITIIIIIIIIIINNNIVALLSGLRTRARLLTVRISAGSDFEVTDVKRATRNALCTDFPTSSTAPHQFCRGV